jgi:hypothetical protein
MRRIDNNHRQQPSMAHLSEGLATGSPVACMGIGQIEQTDVPKLATGQTAHQVPATGTFFCTDYSYLGSSSVLTVAERVPEGQVPEDESAGGHTCLGSDVKRNMLLAVVRPVVEYGATVWHADAPQQAALESVHHQVPSERMHDWLSQHY